MGGAEDDAGDAEKEEQEDDAAADAAAVGVGMVCGAGAVEDPLGEEDDASGEEEHGPPASVPDADVGVVEAADAEQEEDDSDGDEEDRAEDGAAAGSASLEALLVAVGLPLLAGDVALVAVACSRMTRR